MPFRRQLIMRNRLHCSRASLDVQKDGQLGRSARRKIFIKSSGEKYSRATPSRDPPIFDCRCCTSAITLFGYETAHLFRHQHARPPASPSECVTIWKASLVFFLHSDIFSAHITNFCEFTFDSDLRAHDDF